MKNTDLAGSQIHLGASFYPEHWKEDQWSEDTHVARLLSQAGSSIDPPFLLFPLSDLLDCSIDEGSVRRPDMAHPLQLCSSASVRARH